MVCKDEVCQWFKNNEPHHRLDLLCGLLNMCLPLELKFISICVEDLGKRDFHDLREAEFKANNSEEINQLSTLLDERTRSKLIVCIALLSPMNHTCSSLLYKILVEAQQRPGTSETNHVKEMMLIYTMVLHHPAFTFEQKRYIAELYGAARRLEAQLLCHQKEAEAELIQALSQNCSAVAEAEACDSGLSVGTETEGDLTTEGTGLLPTPNTHIHHRFHDQRKHGLRTGVGNHVTPQLLRESGGSQDACSSGSGESGELYNDGGTVPTTYIYNSSIYDQQRLVALSNDLLTVAPGYQCNHPGNFHFYQYPQVIGATPGSVNGGRGPISEGSSSEDNGAMPHNRPQTSPFSSPQSSPYVSPLQSLSPSRASSPWSRLTTTTTTTTTTTAATLPHVSSTTSSVSSLSSTHSSPQLVHKIPAVGSQPNEIVQCSTSPASQAHRGKPPASGSRQQRQGDRSGSRTRVSGTHIMEAGTVTGNQNHNHNSPSASRSVSISSGHSKNSSSRWPANSSPVASSTSSSTGFTSSSNNIKNITRQNSQSPSQNCGTNTTCRIPTASAVTTSSSGCKSHSVSIHEGSGVTSTPCSSSAIVNTRNTVSQGGSQDKNVHTNSNNSGARPSPSSEGSSAVYKSCFENSPVNNNNCLNFELCKNERLNKYFRLLSDYSIEDLKRISDHELLERGVTKGALAKLRRVLAGLDTSSNHRPNGFSHPSSNPHSQPSLHSHHIPYNLSYNSSVQSHTTTSISGNSSSPSPQMSIDHPSPSGTPNHTKPKTSSVIDDTLSSDLVSCKNTQVSPQNNEQISATDASESCNKLSSPQTLSHITALPYSQSSNVNSTIPISNISPVGASSTASITTHSITPSSMSTNILTVTTTSVSLSVTTTTTANITTTTNVTQCHAYTVSPSQKTSLSISTLIPNTSSPNTPIVSNQGSHSSNSIHNSYSANQPINSVPTCTSPSNSVPHYMTTPPPPIHHKTPPLPPGQHRTPPPPLGAPPRTSSREQSASSTNTGFISTSGTQQMYYTSNSGSNCKTNVTVSNSISGSTTTTIPVNGTGYSVMGMTLPQPSSSSGNIVLSTTVSNSVGYPVNNVGLPVYTSSGSIPVPPPSSGGLLPMMPPGGQYHPPTYLYHVLGGPPGSHTYGPPAYAAQHPHRPLYIPPLGPLAHMKATATQSGAPIISGSSSRGSSSSGSSSSSSSSSCSIRNYKKGVQRNGPAKVPSHSSDSSPSSSQYSSPPQTPSPDHTRESNAEKRGKALSEDNCEAGEHLTLLGSGASEDGTPPPLQPHPIHIVSAHAPIPRHRFMPYQHVAVWTPHSGMIRYPGFSLPTQGPGVAPRNPVPLNSEKSSRETTPPAAPLVQQDPQCCIRTADGSTVPTTSNASTHSRNGGSPLNAVSHQEGLLPPAHNPVPSVASTPTGQVPSGNTCSGAPHASVQYNAGYPMFMGAHMFQHFHGFVPSHSSAISNGFVPPSIPPSFPFPTMGNGMNGEFLYGGQYPLLSGTSQSAGGPAPVCGTPSGIGPPSNPGSGLTAPIPYPHFHPTLPHTHNPSAGAKKTCYNCGQLGHRGAECKEARIEEMCKRTKDRLV